jgi:hypothetical protein
VLPAEDSAVVAEEHDGRGRVGPESAQPDCPAVGIRQDDRGEPCGEPRGPHASRR